MRCAIILVVLSIAMLTAIGCENGNCSEDGDSPRTGRAAVVLLRISRMQLDIFSTEPSSYNAEEYRHYRATQSAVLKSAFVLQAALSDEKVASMAVIAKSEKPVKWFQKKLVTNCVEDSEVMEVRLFDEAMSEEDLKVVLDAVIHAYIEEVVHAERNNRIKRTNLLKRSYSVMLEKLIQEQAMYRDLASTLNCSGSPSAEIRRTILLDELRRNREARLLSQERITDEWMQLHLARELAKDRAGKEKLPPVESNESESDAETGILEEERDSEPSGAADETDQGAEESRDIANPPEKTGEVVYSDTVVLAKHGFEFATSILTPHIQQLDQRAVEIKEELIRLSKPSSDLERRRNEIESLRDLVKRMKTKLLARQLAINLADSPRIQVLQNARIEETEE